MKGFIICIGNRFVASDSGGLQVYDNLQKRQVLPVGVKVIEGGLAGLNLLPLLEQGGRVVFVDAVEGFVDSGKIVLLNQQEILKSNLQPHFDHGAGLAYLLAMLPRVCEGELPEEISLVGLEGNCSPQMIEQAASMSLRVVSHGLKDFS